MITKRTIKLFGVAGAGKTTFCVEIVKRLLGYKVLDKNAETLFSDRECEYKFEDIIFTTYTKAGVESMAHKLKSEGVLIGKSTNIRTLNSLTWKLAGFGNPRDNKLRNEKEMLFNKAGFKDVKGPDSVLSDYDLVTNMYDSAVNFYSKSLKEISFDEVIRYINNSLIDSNFKFYFPAASIAKLFLEYETWKEKTGFKDYVDSLLYVYKNQIDCDCRVLIVDEAQDLGKLQTKIINMWVHKYTKDFFIISGDDDQTLYVFSGATPEYLINFNEGDTNKIILNHTWRLPPLITSLCNDILKKIRVREKKTLISNNNNISRIGFTDSTLEQYPLLLNKYLKEFKGGKLFILCRTNKIKKQMSDFLYKYCDNPFSLIEGKTSSNQKWSMDFIATCNAINKLSRVITNNGKDLDIHKQELISLFDSLPESWLKNGLKHKAKKEDKLWYNRKEVFDMFRLFSPQKQLNDFTDNNVAMTTKQRMIAACAIYYTSKTDRATTFAVDMRNDAARDKMKTINYLIPFDYADPKKFGIQLGTFHASKGLEADSVFVCLGSSPAFSKILMDPNKADEEIRAFYVACSRTKGDLCFISSYREQDSVATKDLENFFQSTLRKHINWYPKAY